MNLLVSAAKEIFRGPDWMLTPATMSSLSFGQRGRLNFQLPVVFLEFEEGLKEGRNNIAVC